MQEIRLHTLAPFVHKFHIFNSDVTYSGIPKEFKAQNVTERLPAFASQIRYHQIKDPLNIATEKKKKSSDCTTMSTGKKKEKKEKKKSKSRQPPPKPPKSVTGVQRFHINFHGEWLIRDVLHRTLLDKVPPQGLLFYGDMDEIPNITLVQALLACDLLYHNNETSQQLVFGTDRLALLHQPMLLKMNFHCRATQNPWPYGTVILPIRLSLGIHIWDARIARCKARDSLGLVLKLTPYMGWHLSSIAFTLHTILWKYSSMTETFHSKSSWSEEKWALLIKNGQGNASVDAGPDMSYTHFPFLTLLQFIFDHAGTKFKHLLSPEQLDYAFSLGAPRLKNPTPTVGGAGSPPPPSLWGPSCWFGRAGRCCAFETDP